MEDKLQMNIELCKAIQNCDLLKVKEALKNKADPHARIDSHSWFSPWKWAYACEKSSIVSHLLENGADANARLEENFHQTLIFGAILSRNKQIITVLVEEGADLNIMDDDGYTPLYLTLGKSKCLSLVPLLLELGADMRVGISKLVKARKHDPKSYEAFCEQIGKFLEESDKNDNYKVLEAQLPVILQVAEHLPGDLVDQARELKKIYCSDNGLDVCSMNDDKNSIVEEVGSSNKDGQAHNKPISDNSADWTDDSEEIKTDLENLCEKEQNRGGWVDSPWTNVPVSSKGVLVDIERFSKNEYNQNELINFSVVDFPVSLFKSFLKMIKQAKYEIQTRVPQAAQKKIWQPLISLETKIWEINTEIEQENVTQDTVNENLTHIKNKLEKTISSLFDSASEGKNVSASNNPDLHKQLSPLVNRSEISVNMIEKKDKNWNESKVEMHSEFYEEDETPAFRLCYISHVRDIPLYPNYQYAQWIKAPS